MSGWSIQKLLKDEKFLPIAKEDWEKAGIGRPHLGILSTEKDLDKKLEWFESKLFRMLNNHIKIMRIMTYSQ